MNLSLKVGVPVLGIGFACVLLSSCGGSAGPSSTGAEDETSVGPLTVRTAGAVPPPLVLATNGLVVTGMAGASFSLARLNFPAMTQLNQAEVMARTLLAFDRTQRTAYLNMGNGLAVTVNPDRNPTRYPSTPSLSPLGDRIYSSEYDASSAQNRIHVTNLDGTGRTMLSGQTQSSFFCDVSPDGTKIAFHGGDASIYVMPASGGVPTRLTSANSDYIPKWSPDGTKIMFLRSNSTSVWIPWVMNSDGSGQAVAIPNSPPLQVSGTDWTPSGGFVTLRQNSTGVNEIIVYDRAGRSQQLVLGTTDSLNGVTVSPDGSTIAFGRSAFGASDLYTVPTLGGSERRLTNDGLSLFPNWGPYIRAKSLIGNGGALSQGAGFLLAQRGKEFPSYVVFDATTRSGVTVSGSAETDNQPNLVVTIDTADNLTQLRFSNSLFLPSTSIVSSGAPVSGALVSFDTGTGEVASVIPYIGATPKPVKAGITLEYRGDFHGVFDRDGNNLAPSGARRVAIETRHGAPSVMD